MKEKNIKIPDFIKEKVLGFGNNPQKPIFYIKDLEVGGEQIPIYSTGDLEYLAEFLKDSSEFRSRGGIRANNSFILLTMNNFPYDLEEGV